MNHKNYRSWVGCGERSEPHHSRWITGVGAARWLATPYNVAGFLFRVDLAVAGLAVVGGGQQLFAGCAVLFVVSPRR